MTMQAAVNTVAPKRRTQEERRATTRKLLLDATIEGLIGHGYRELSTWEIAERAGVSRGARSHHFRTKAELVIEAVRHLYDGLTETYEKAFARVSPRADRQTAAFRLLWSMFVEPRHAAVIELYVAARTDPELCRSLHAVAAQHHANIIRLARVYFPELARHRDFDTLIDTIVATMFGLAVRRIVFGEDITERHVLRFVQQTVATHLTRKE